MGKDADHGLLTTNKGNGGFRCVTEMSIVCAEVSRLIFYSSTQLAVVVASSTMVAARHILTDLRAASQTGLFVLDAGVCVSEKQLSNLQYSSAWYLLRALNICWTEK